MTKNTPHILVLGATGFVGHAVFSYLSTKSITYGASSSSSKHFFHFTVDNYENDFENIIKKIKHISLVINCIGVYKNVSKETLISINALFPHHLEKLASEYNFQLIHISSDAVFGALQGKVTEDSVPIPDTTYGITKLLGETNSPSAITFRTSFLGLDHVSRKGLVETVLHNEHLEGYINQQWSGCTTYQFAKLCASLTTKSAFTKLRKYSPFFHFTPLPPKTKFAIMKEILKQKGLKKNITSIKKQKIYRILASKYTKELSLSSYKQTYQKALEELFSIENKKLL